MCLNFIRTNQDLILKTKKKIIKNPNFEEMGFFGNLFGTVYKGNTISKKQTLLMLELESDIDEIIEKIRFIVGNAWFYMKNDKNIYLISTTSAPSLYLYHFENKLFFSRYEHLVFQLAIKNNEDLNPYEIYDMFHAKRADSAPYGALFKNVLRIPDGHIIKIGKDLTINKECYLNFEPKYQYERNYENFKLIIENMAKLYIKSQKKVHVLFSTGIDSFVILLALQKFSDNIIPVATTQDFNGSYDNGRIREKVMLVEKELGIKSKLIYANRYSNTQREIRDEITKICSSNVSRWDSFVFWSIMEEYKECENCIFLAGIPMDIVYAPSYTKKSFKKTQIKRNFKLIIKRYFNTKFYQRNLQNFFHKLLRRKIRSKKISIHPKIEFFSSLIYMKEYQTRKIPLLYKKSKHNNDFYNEYRIYKKEKFLSLVFKNESEMLKLNKEEINSKFRILRRYFSGPNQIRANAAHNYFQEATKYYFGNEGPIVDFFRNYKLGLKYLKEGKSFYYRYFKERTNKRYNSIFNTRKIKKYTKKIHKKMEQNNFHLREASLNKYFSSEAFHEDFFNIVNYNNPVILKILKHPYVKQYVKEYYKDGQKGLLNFHELMKIYTIESFLQNLFE